MNKAITDGIDLMPPAFADGLTDWSSADGTPGSPDYSGAANAALVASDQDFGTCLEIQKIATTQKLRYKGEVPVLPGCYLRVSARVKAISGPLPSVRIAGWAGAPGGVHVGGVQETGPQTALTSYGRIYEISAYVGTGLRAGVDMVWGGGAVYGHFGLDILGANGSVVRIESIRIDDMTLTFHRNLMDWVDVRDYGAKGDGVTDDSTAFEAADAAAGGREVLVSSGVYLLNRDVTMASRCRFEGTVTLPTQFRFALTGNFDYATYVDAFGDETLALKKALQALFNFSDHESLDLGGRRIQLTEPIDVQAAVGNVATFANRRAIRNGQLSADNSVGFETVTYNSSARYVAVDGLKLIDVVNVAAIPIGSLVTGVGVGREIYVRSKNVAAQTLTLSQPLFGVASVQNYTFKRFKYLLDFSGFDQLQRFQVDDIEFLCNGYASGIMLPKDGIAWHIRDCWFTKPKDRGVTSIGTGCYSLVLDANEFVSNETDVPVASRTSVAFNSNADDLKVRNNRAVRFRHFGVMAGSGNIISGNHFWQGDDSVDGERSAGIVMSARNVKTVLTGNYVDNCWIEMNNEHDAFPNRGPGEMAFGTLSVTANIFTANTVPTWFSWLHLAPYGTGHNIDGISVIGNTFRVVAGHVVDRVESLDTSRGAIDLALTRDLVFVGNSFESVTIRSQTPTMIVHDQVAESNAWSIATSAKLPFGCRAMAAEGLTAVGPITDGAAQNDYAQPYVVPQQGLAGDQVAVHWPVAVKGTVHLRVRADLAA